MTVLSDLDDCRNDMNGDVVEVDVISRVDVLLEVADLFVTSLLPEDPVSRWTVFIEITEEGLHRKTIEEFTQREMQTTTTINNQLI